MKTVAWDPGWDVVSHPLSLSSFSCQGCPTRACRGRTWPTGRGVKSRANGSPGRWREAHERALLLPAGKTTLNLVSNMENGNSHCIGY